MTTRLHTERGSAMVEAAILFPCLMLIVWWSAAITDVMVLKLKAAEAVRYTLWESTVFKPPAQIDSEVQQRFVDLRSPKSINVNYTSLLMYPLASNLAWKANVDTTTSKVSMGGNRTQTPGTGGILDTVMNLIANALSSAVDPSLRFFKFNMNGEAVASVTLVRATHDEQASRILKGGNLLGDKGGADLDHPKSMTNFTFRAPLPAERPMRLVFDTWKAWPKPAAYTTDGGPTNVAVAPSKTYPVVEDMVSAQVKHIAFFGLTSQSWFNWVNNLTGKILGYGIMKTLVGGTLPLVFDATRMDASTNRGPITILPPEGLGSEASYVPKQCVINGNNTPCPSQRIGDVTANSLTYLDNNSTLGDRVDRTRYTIPYKINTVYWRSDGGTDHAGEGSSLSSPKTQLTQKNDFVLTYACRGHFFSGATAAEQTDPTRRYRSSCNK